MHTDSGNGSHVNGCNESWCALEQSLRAITEVPTPSDDSSPNGNHISSFAQTANASTLSPPQLHHSPGTSHSPGSGSAGVKSAHSERHHEKTSDSNKIASGEMNAHLNKPSIVHASSGKGPWQTDMVFELIFDSDAPGPTGPGRTELSRPSARTCQNGPKSSPRKKQGLPLKIKISV